MTIDFRMSVNSARSEDGKNYKRTELTLHRGMPTKNNRRSFGSVCRKKRGKLRSGRQADCSLIFSNRSFQQRIDEFFG